MADSEMYRRAEKRLIRDGFILKRETGHRIWYNPDGRRISVPSTPGEGRGWANFEADLKRLGVPPLTKKHQRNVNPMLKTEPIGPAPVQLKIISKKPLLKRQSQLQVSVAEVLVAQEMLKGRPVPGYGMREKYIAVGKIVLRWLDQNDELRLLAERFADSLQPDYETVFAGTFVCDELVNGEKCGRVLMTPAALGLHKAHTHGVKGALNPRILAQGTPTDDLAKEKRLAAVNRVMQTTQVADTQEPPIVPATVEPPARRHKPTREEIRARYTKAGYVAVGYNRCRRCHKPGHNARTCKGA